MLFNDGQKATHPQPTHTKSTGLYLIRSQNVGVGLIKTSVNRQLSQGLDRLRQSKSNAKCLNKFNPAQLKYFQNK
jgi:hypothetical protein